MLHIRKHSKNGFARSSILFSITRKEFRYGKNASRQRSFEFACSWPGYLPGMQKDPHKATLQQGLVRWGDHQGLQDLSEQTECSLVRGQEPGISRLLFGQVSLP